MSVEQEVIALKKKKNVLSILVKRYSRVEPENEKESEELSTSKSTPNKTLIRLSDNFTFCCSGNTATTSPNYGEAIPIVKPNIRSRDHLRLDLELLEAIESIPKIPLKGKIKVNLQKPITESKSRFRTRYLPQNITIEENDDNSKFVKIFKQSEHFSNPDLTQKSPDLSERK